MIAPRVPWRRLLLLLPLPLAAVLLAWLPGFAVAQPAAREARVFDVELIVFRPLAPAHLDERQWLEAARELAREAAGGGSAADGAGVGGSAPGDAMAGEAGDAAPYGGTGAMAADGRDAPRGADAWPGPVEGDIVGRGAGRDVSPVPADVADAVLPPLTPQPDWRAPLPEHPAELHPDTFELTDVARRLRLSAGYRPMLHRRWRQFAFPRDTASDLPLEVVVDDLHLTGTVRVAVERRLHLALDLTLAPVQGGIPYRLAQSRVMLSEELHYIDHPAFGVLCRITRAEFPENYPDHVLPGELLAATALLAPPAERIRPLPRPEDPAPATTPNTTPGKEEGGGRGGAGR